MRQVFYPVASVLKHAEGGRSQKDVRHAASELGIDVRFKHSPYLGHYSVCVKTEDKRKIGRLLEAIW
jgi:hypothetical protein